MSMEKNNPKESRTTSYIIINKIASGGFGEIHSAKEKSTDKKVAIKIEKSDEPGQLKNEYRIYKVFSKDNKTFLPKIYGYGSMIYEGKAANGLVMDLLGPSLETLFTVCKKKFSLQTVLKTGETLLDIIEYIHSNGFIHRDIKPENFVFDNGEEDFTKFYIVDFGLSKLYRNTSTYAHIPFKKGKSLTGTARYASINSHLGIEQSRRDDLESLVYCLIYFMKGKLPWQGLTGQNKQEKFAKIRRVKEMTPVTTICDGLPIVFLKMLHYTRSLSFDELPSYLYLRNMIKRAFVEEKLIDIGSFDWNSNGVSINKPYN